MMRINKWVRINWITLLLVFFWQTRFAICCQGQVVDYLIPFVYLSDLLFLALIATTLWEKCRSLRLLLRLPAKKLKLLKPLMTAGAAFLLFAAASNLGATHQLGAWYKWLKLVEIGALISLTASQQPQTKNSSWYWLSLGLVPVALIAWGEFLMQRSLGLQVLGEWQFSVAQPGIAKVVLAGKQLLRPYATFPHPNVLGGVFSLVAVVNLWQVLEKRTLRITDYGLQITSFLLFSSVVLISFSRSAWLAYVAMLAVTLWLQHPQLPSKSLKKLKLFITVTVIAVTFLVVPRLLTLTTADALSWQRRVQLNNTAIAMIKDNPLTGVGLNNFVPNLEKHSVIAGQGRFLQPVHNVPLLIAAEVGLPAFSLLLSAFGLLLYKLWQREEFLLLTLWFGISTTSLFDHYWFTLQHGLLILGLTTGLSLSSIREDET